MPMNTVIRKATADDFAVILEIYHKIHTEEEKGRATTGWIRGIYPEAPTINDALARNDLFVAECDGKILASAIFNQIQVDVYAGAAWQFPAPDNQVMVMHTLVKNIAARHLYQKLGYKEIGVAPCTFNGLEGINLVLLEKKI